MSVPALEDPRAAREYSPTNRRAPRSRQAARPPGYCPASRGDQRRLGRQAVAVVRRGRYDFGLGDRTLPELWKLLGHIDAVHGLPADARLVCLFPPTEFWSRLPSCLADRGRGGGVVVFAKQFPGGATALCAGAIFAILPRMTWAGIEARSYGASVAAAAVWLTVLFVAAVRRNRPR